MSFRGPVLNLASMPGLGPLCALCQWDEEVIAMQTRTQALDQMQGPASHRPLMPTLVKGMLQASVKDSIQVHSRELAKHTPGSLFEEDHLCAIWKNHCCAKSCSWPKRWGVESHLSSRCRLYCSGCVWQSACKVF